MGVLPLFLLPFFFVFFVFAFAPPLKCRPLCFSRSSLLFVHPLSVFRSSFCSRFCSLYKVSCSLFFHLSSPPLFFVLTSLLSLKPPPVFLCFLSNLPSLFFSFLSFVISSKFPPVLFFSWKKLNLGNNLKMDFDNCIEPNVMFIHSHPSNLYSSGCLMLAQSVPFWTVDLGATNHIKRDQTIFMKFHLISKESRYIYMWNNVSAAVLGIGTCKLDLQGGHTFYLHDLLYAPEV